MTEGSAPPTVIESPDKAAADRSVESGLHESESPAREPGARRRVRRRGSARAPTGESLRDWLEAQGSRLVLGLLGAAVALSFLLVGAVHVPVMLGCATLAIAAGALALWLGSGEVPLPAAALLLLGLAAFTALQATPLPFELLAAVAPHNADVWARARLPLGEAAPAWASLSLDPGASWAEVVKWMGYAAILLAGAHLGHRYGARATAFVVFGVAAVGALVTLGHASTSADRLYGVYEPMQARPPWALGPLLNPNNLAGYLNLGAFTGMGLAVSARSSGPRWLLALAVATTVAVSILSGSRGGVAALLVGSVLIVVAIRAVRRRRRHRLASTPAAGAELAAILLGGGLLFYLGARPDVWRALLDESTAKFLILDWTRPLIADHSWLGVGRGAYETAFPPYRQQAGHIVYQAPENFVVQWLAEWGLIVGGLGLLGLLFVLRPSRLGVGRDPVAAGAAVGTATLLLHNLSDLALEIPAVGFALFALLGGLWGAARERDSERGRVVAAPSWLVAGPRWRLALAVGGIGAVALVISGLCSPRTAFLDRRRLHADYTALTQARAEPSAIARFKSELRAALDRHPGDPYLPLLGALIALYAGEPPLAWFNRALERDPLAGRPYLVLSDYLARLRRPRQALLPLRLAAERDVTLGAPVAARALALTQEPDELLQTVPPGAAGARLLVTLAHRLPPGAFATRDRFARQALEQDPSLISAHLLSAGLLLEALGPETTHPGCVGAQRAECVARVQRHAAEAERLDPALPNGILLRARLLLAQKDPAGAERLLAEGCTKYPTALDCWRLWVTAAAAANNDEALHEAGQSLLALACVSRERCGSTAGWLGDLWASRRDWHRATALYERAASETQDPKLWLKVASAAARSGKMHRAQSALSRARSLGGEADPALLRALEQSERERLLRGIGP